MTKIPLVMLLAVSSSLAGCASTGRAPGAVTSVESVQALSNRADLISGGDALVEIHLDRQSGAARPVVTLNGEDISTAFAQRADGRMIGLVEGLRQGENTVTASIGRSAQTLSITNHPRGGPVFSGPQLPHWTCMTEANDLGAPADVQCNANTKVDYLYRSTDPTKNGFTPYDRMAPPGDVATATTDAGTRVPFIVRRERGTYNRYVYDIAVLADPSERPSPTQPPRAWNGKLYYIFQGGAMPQHVQGVVPEVLHERALSRGFATATSSGNVYNNNVNSVVSAETMMMVKERVAEAFGPIRYTLAEGASGGSIQQQMIANAYPGLLDGIQPAASYPDMWTTLIEVQDCSLLERYFGSAADMWSDGDQRAAVMDNAPPSPLGPGTCHAWNNIHEVFGRTAFTLFDRGSMDPTSASCLIPGQETGFKPEQGRVGSPRPWMYDPVSNPGGQRCTVQDYQVNIMGRRPDGFANRPFDNVGVQYGLVAFQRGTISADQFVDLNEKIGGRDIEWRHTRERSVADLPALTAVYRSGQVNDGARLNQIPVIDLRPCLNFEIHSCFHSWSTRERLERTDSTFENQIIWVWGLPDLAGAKIGESSFDLLDEWVGAVKSDPSPEPVAAKVARHRPSSAVDTCWIDGSRTEIATACRNAYPIFGNPRTGAGDSLSVEILKCQLRPLDRASYQRPLSDQQWSRLQATFPTGVCDWTLQGVNQVPSVQWLSYSNGSPGVTLGAAPRSAAK